MSTMTKAERAAAKSDIEAGAFVPPGRDPVVAEVDTYGGMCGYCGEVIIGRVSISARGAQLAVTPLAWRWINKELVPWHCDCLKWVMHWVQNADGTVHLTGCQLADADGLKLEGTRGELRWALDPEFCETCAPLDAWFSDEPVAYPESARGRVTRP
jgi:hypothetical protein